MDNRKTPSYGGEAMSDQMRARLAEWLEPQPGELLTRSRQRDVLKWAMLGRPKPSRYVGGYRGDMEQVRLIEAVYSATNPNNARFYGHVYDREFDELIRALRPDWFLPLAERFKGERRIEWLDRARLGLPKPEGFTRSEVRKLGIEMDLRRLRPEWFVTPVDEKRLQFRSARKQVILEKARMGQEFTHAERQALYMARRSDSPSFDPEFCARVDAYRPTLLKGSIFRKEGA